MSNYLTILLAFQELIENEKIPAGEIFVGSSMFSLYGNPDNWFDPSRVIKEKFFGSYVKFDTMTMWYRRNERSDFRYNGYPGLSAYKKYFDYNAGVAGYLKQNVRKFDKCLGVHFRGTDNNYGKAPGDHAVPVALSVFLAHISKELDTGKYENIFVATDESGVIENIKDHCREKHGFDKIHFNPVTRSENGTALHRSGYDRATRIRLGYEILLDVHCLSECGTVICKASNITSYLRVLSEKTGLLRVDR